MMDEINLTELLKKYTTKIIPKWFNLREILTTTQEKISWSNETHIQQEGYVVSRIQIHFPRDTVGKFSPELDAHPTPVFVDLQKSMAFKYTKEGRIYLGEALLPFNYLMGLSNEEE